MDAKIIYCSFLAWPDFFKKFFTFIFTTGYVPHFLEFSKLILLSKPNKPAYTVNSYRPICLAPYFSKILDKFLLHRLMFHLHNFSPISDYQFGFLDNRNTEQALNFIIKTLHRFKSTFKYVAVIAADISAAFDSIRFDDIHDALISRGINKSFVKLIMSLISARILIFYHPTAVIYINTTKGVPQGSSIAPILWNLVLDTLLRVPLPNNIMLSAYADDISLVIAGNTRKNLEMVGNNALAKLLFWTNSKDLTGDNLKVWYHTVIERIIVYAASVWG